MCQCVSDNSRNRSEMHAGFACMPQAKDKVKEGAGSNQTGATSFGISSSASTSHDGGFKALANNRKTQSQRSASFSFKYLSPFRDSNDSSRREEKRGVECETGGTQMETYTETLAENTARTETG